MLLDMKSKVEGIRALAVKLVHHQDSVDFYSHGGAPNDPDKEKKTAYPPGPGRPSSSR